MTFSRESDSWVKYATSQVLKPFIKRTADLLRCHFCFPLGVSTQTVYVCLFKTDCSCLEEDLPPRRRALVKREDLHVAPEIPRSVSFLLIEEKTLNFRQPESQ